MRTTPGSCVANSSTRLVNVLWKRRAIRKPHPRVYQKTLSSGSTRSPWSPRPAPIDHRGQENEVDQLDYGDLRDPCSFGISTASNSAPTSQATETRIVRESIRRKRRRSTHPRSVTVRQNVSPAS